MPSPSVLVTVLRILLFIAAPACLALAGLLFWVQFTFSRRPKTPPRPQEFCGRRTTSRTSPSAARADGVCS